MNVSRVVVPYMKLSKSLITSNANSSVAAQRWYATNKGSVHPGYTKIKEKYTKFQIDDGTPIHLKGGAMDRLLYYTTIAGCGIGLVMCFEYYYSASFPKKDC